MFQPLLAALGLYHDDHDLVASDLGLDHLWDVSRCCQMVRTPDSDASYIIIYYTSGLRASVQMWLWLFLIAKRERGLPCIIR